MPFSVTSFSLPFLLFFSSFSRGENPEATWKKILEKLNETQNGTTLPFTHSVETDLLELNKTEMGTIEKKWLEKNPQAKKEKRGVLRKEKNIFFQKEVEALNAPFFKALEKSAAETPKGVDYRVAAEKALTKIDSHPMTRTDNVYQIKDGDQIGFCFSRALLIHHWLVKERVQQRDIAKVFTIGELSVEGTFWQFHVAVWIRDSKEGFLVVDPLQKKVLPYKDWLKINKDYDVKVPYSRVRFYMTSPRKFLPSFGPYEVKLLQNPHFKEYFEQLVPFL